MLPINWVCIAKMLVGVMDTWKNSMALIDSQLAVHRRRRRIANILALRQKQLTMLMAAKATQKRYRAKWEVKRAKVFWEKYCKVLTDEKFKSYFRISRNSFTALCVILQKMEKSDTNMRRAISLKKRVAVALYVLGSSTEYRNIANLFGIGKSTVCKIVVEFCKTAWAALRPHYFNAFPLNQSKIDEYVCKFDALGFPQCLGVLDSCHIPIRSQKVEASEYRNSSGWISLILLALVDGGNNFVFINSQCPGRFSPSTAYENSSLKRYLSKCTLLNEMTQEINDTEVPVFILGDETFRLGNNLMKPYPCTTEITEEEEVFNYMVSKCRKVATNALVNLKARFRRIGGGIDNKVENVQMIIRTCCALHNFLNAYDDNVNDKWLVEQRMAEKDTQQPIDFTVVNDSDPEAEQIRNALSNYFALFGTGCVSISDVLDNEYGLGDGSSSQKSSSFGTDMDSSSSI